jgi:PIN domain nuclease of toxin-antitoxin system
MTYLLDTHVYFWWKSDPDRLPVGLIELLSDPGNELLLSVVTPWELAIKTRAGKFDGLRLLKDFEARETAAGFMIIRPSAAQAIRSGLLPVHHKDPFDRLLAAQALDLGVALLSRDQVFDMYGVRRIWACPCLDRCLTGTRFGLSPRRFGHAEPLSWLHSWNDKKITEFRE